MKANLKAIGDALYKELQAVSALNVEEMDFGDEKAVKKANMVFERASKMQEVTRAIVDINRFALDTIKTGIELESQGHDARALLSQVIGEDIMSLPAKAEEDNA